LGMKRPATTPPSAARQAPSEASLVKPATHIRRCTYRKVTALATGRRELPVYAVDCLHPVYEERALPLGDLTDAYAACAACTLPGIFRADED
ncbi:MAG TPA: hypothetical protein VH741_08755, partial [Candidatus Limnocylindrales bacterium]